MPDVSEAAKGYDPKAVAASVVQPQVVVGNGLPSDYSQALAQSSIVWAVTQAATEIIPWGINPTRRDLQLRQFLTTESVVSSAFAAVIARNAGYSWRLDGPPLTVRRAQNILHSANGGEGWLNFVTRLWWDASTQDKGGFIEIIRDGNSPDAPCIGIQSLDAARCLGRDSRVWMADGRKVPIADVVENRDPGPVMSLRSDGTFEPKPITGWYRSALGNRQWMQLRLKSARRTYGRGETLWLTDDHEVLTPDGYCRASDLSVGSEVFTADPQPNALQTELLIGTLLGDSSLSRGRKQTDRVSIQMGHSPKQEEWLRLKMTALAGMGWGPTRRTRTLIQTASAATPSLRDMAEEFYPEDGKKIVPRGLVEQHFGPRLLAAWFADDGARQTGRWGRDRARFATYGFEPRDSEWLAGLLTQHGYTAHSYTRRLRVGPYAGRTYTGIYVTADGAENLFRDIAPYLPPSIRHKLPEGCQDYEPSLWNLGQAEPWAAEVVSIESGENGGQQTAYCIDVADNHNFVAGNTVVHNCFHTGDPENPVVYLDRKGRFHLLAWYQVVTVSEMPMPHELLYGLQLCALSRVLHGAQVFRNIQIYMDEKTGGRNTRAIHVISGIAKAEMQAAIDLTQQNADNRGQLRYIQPVILTTLQDKPISRETLELATLPDGFDSDQVFKQYLTIVSLGLLTDFQEFAPLPGGGLGTSAQSEVLHAKSRGKGAMLFRKIMEHIFNFSGILPQNVTFTYDEQDVAAEAELAKVRLDRANTWQIYVNMGLTDAAGIQQLALDDGDIPQELFDRMSEQQDLTDPGTVEQSDTTVAPEEDPIQAAELKAERDIRPHGVAGSPKVEDARLAFESEMTGAIEGGFARARRDIEKVLMKAKELEPPREPETTASVVEKVVRHDDAGKVVGVTEYRIDGITEKRLKKDRSGRILGIDEEKRK